MKKMAYGRRSPLRNQRFRNPKMSKISGRRPASPLEISVLGTPRYQNFGPAAASPHPFEIYVLGFVKYSSGNCYSGQCHVTHVLSQLSADSLFGKGLNY